MPADSLYADVHAKRRRGRAILFDSDSACLQGLLDLLAGHARLTVTRWALTAAEPLARRLAQQYPFDSRPADCLRLGWAWARGQVKLPQAKRAILALHAMAGEMSSPAEAACCHALAQACSTVHTPGHAKGLPFYELTGLALQYAEDFEGPVTRRIADYTALLLELAQSPAPGPWAAFLLKPDE